MIIRKLFKFENAHRVYGAWSRKCSSAIHGHSYKLEVFLEGECYTDPGMIVDFGRIKRFLDPIIDAFDHSICFCHSDPVEYIDSVKMASDRWIQLPCSPTAEELSRLFYLLFDNEFKNGEVRFRLHSVRVHETDTGYAECYQKDAFSCRFGIMDFSKFETSEEINLKINLDQTWLE